MYKRLNKKEKHLLLFLLLFAIAVRIVFFILYLSSGCTHCDEAMLIINARSLCDNGTSISGTSFPVFFDTWVYGGQSAFGTYIVALFIKIFGYSLAITRIPILIISIAGIIALFFFCLRVFKNHKIAYIALVFAAVSPWHIFQSVWTIDCAFLPHIFMIALSLFACTFDCKKKRTYYILSMIFFGLCFYCYMPSIFIVPPFLLVAYTMLMQSKKISLSDILVSVITIFVISLPFILFGLVSIGVLEPFTIGKITFSISDKFSRQNNIIISNLNSPNVFCHELIQNIGSAILFLLLPVISYSSYEFTKFPYLGISATILLTLLIAILLVKRKSSKSKTANNISRIFYIPLIFAAIIYIFNVCGVELISCYRYSWMYYMLFVLCAYSLTKLAKKDMLLKAISISLILGELVTTSFVYFGYIKNIKNISSVDNSLGECISFVNSNNFGTVSFINHYKKSAHNEQEATFIRFYIYKDKDTLVPLYDDLSTRGMANISIKDDTNSEINLRKDGKWRYINSDSVNNKDDAYVVFYGDLKNLKYDKTLYESKDFGSYYVVYKSTDK